MFLTAAALLVAPAAASAVTRTVTFSPTGTEQTFLVPAGVTALSVTATGGNGGGGVLVAGGTGATVTGTIQVTPGQTVFVTVGGNGASRVSGGAGGFNGGGSGRTPGVELGAAEAGRRTSARSSAPPPVRSVRG